MIENQDRAVFEAIQKGVDKANEDAVSNAQKVSMIAVPPSGHTGSLQ